MTHIITICPLGEKTETTEQNKAKLLLLERILEQLEKVEWPSIDAILLPGGYFFLDNFIGNHNAIARKQLLEREELHQAVMKLTARLHALNARAFIIAGVDAGSPKATMQSDHLCIAWNHEGIQGIGRKIFTTDGDTNGSDPLICYSEDFSTDNRVITLPSGANALLCACYDMFGVPEAIDNTTARTGYIRYIHHDGEVRSVKDQQFKTLRSEHISKWEQLLDSKQVSIALCAIHGFARPGKDVLWQRHGIAAASAALNGLALGASHFVQSLPRPDSATLSANRVPREHLAQGLQRKAHELKPLASFKTEISKESQAIVRLYQAV